jgi:hypothetical protein
MFNLFAAKRSSDIQIAKSAMHLLTLMKRAVHERQAMIAAQGDEHHEIDLRLIVEIRNVLEPLIVWFQSMDWYGDGIRHLEFHRGRFPMSAIPKLQALLREEYAPFGILCWAPVELDVPPEHEQGLVIFSNTIVITARLASGIGMPSKSSNGAVAKAARR